MTEPDKIYHSFKSRIEQDLTKWEDRLADQRKDIDGYKQILQLIDHGPKLRVDLGSNFFMNAQLVNKKLILKTIDNIYVEVSYEEARKMVPVMIEIVKKREQDSLKMIAYIMASREEIDMALEKFEG